MAKNKILSSEHYTEIHERLARGEPPKDVSEWLWETYEEKSSPRTCSRYLSKYINIEDKTRAKYNQRKSESKKKEKEKKKSKEIEETEKITDEVSESLVDDLEIMDSLIKILDESLDISQLTENQKANLLIKLWSVKSNYLGTDNSDLINRIGEENLFEYDPEELEMIKNWGKQQDKEFIDKL